MVARAEALRARESRGHAPLEKSTVQMRNVDDETDPIANRTPLVQVDAPSADVARTWPVRVPEVRAAPSSVLGTIDTVLARRNGIAARSAGPKRPGNRSGIEDPIFMTIAPATLVGLDT